MAARFPSGPHAHGCPRCHTRYMDLCTDLGSDALCLQCRAGKHAGWQELIDNREPKDCCRFNARLARKEELPKYHLAGACTWWLCPTCQRTHPYPPMERP